MRTVRFEVLGLLLVAIPLSLIEGIHVISVVLFFSLCSNALIADALLEV